MSALTGTRAWQTLAAAHEKLHKNSLQSLVGADPDRFAGFSARHDGVLFDYSRQLLDATARDALLALAGECDVAGWRDRLYAGEAVNHTEGRAALHMALRAQAGDDWPVLDEVLDARQRMYAFASQVRDDSRTTDVVHIGIGGSHLGPALVCDALAALHDGPRVHFVSNVDGTDLARTLAQCTPESTQFIIASKTFTTQETMANARTARAWTAGALDEAAVAGHFSAVSAHPARAVEFGIDPDRVFGFGDWVGGRYSLWSSIGLPAAIALGTTHFDALLAGARSIDIHFRDAPDAANIPLLMGLIGVWNTNFLGCATHAVLPYAEALRLLPAYLQQLEMESLGKRVDRDGDGVDYATAPVLWGAAGTDGQHAFHQLLHQGTQTVPVDFIGFRGPAEEGSGQHHILLANLLAQAEALLMGTGADEPYRRCPGARPSSVLVFDALTPYTLGQLIATYEHKVFVEGVVWHLNPFDQWGVELGKRLGGPLLAELQGGARGEHDPATAGLLDYLKEK